MKFHKINESVLQQIFDDAVSLDLVQGLTPALVATAQQLLGIVPGPAASPLSSDGQDARQSGPGPTSWFELIDAISADLPSATTCLDNSTWLAWEPPVTHDSELADRLAALTDEGATRIWSIGGPSSKPTVFWHPPPRQHKNSFTTRSSTIGSLPVT